jgi:hypothetical protein
MISYGHAESRASRRVARASGPGRPPPPRQAFRPGAAGQEAVTCQTVVRRTGMLSSSSTTGTS